MTECYTPVTLCYTSVTLFLPDCCRLLPPDKKRAAPHGAASFRLNSSSVTLLPIRLSVARFTQQGGDEVDYFLIRKHEFQGAERPLQYSFHGRISIKLFGGEGTKPGRGGGQCVRLAADGGGYVRLSSAGEARRMRSGSGEAFRFSGHQFRSRRKASAQSGAYSWAALKQGHCFIHSCGSITPFPFRSGLRSRWPQTVLLE